MILVKDLQKKESYLNAICFLIKLDYSLIQKVYTNREDKCLKFINLIIHYSQDNPDINSLIKRIHKGYPPEQLLKEIKTSSADFNNFLQSLLLNNFNSLPISSSEGKSERHFKIFLNEIDSKISIIFFIGLFYPIGICFLFFFKIMNYYLLIGSVPLFYAILHFANKSFLTSNVILIGLTHQNQDEKQQFNELLILLKSFAIFLRKNISHESAIINAYKQIKEKLIVLNPLIEHYITNLISHSYSFYEIISSLKSELVSIRFKLLLDLILRMLQSNSFVTSKKIYELIKWLDIHKEYEKNLNEKIQGEKFKVFIFLILLSFFMGAIAGLIPHFSKFLTMDYKQTLNYSYAYLPVSVNFSIIQFLIVFISLLSINSISAFYFLKIIEFQRISIIFISDLFYIFVFIFVYFNPMYL